MEATIKATEAEVELMDIADQLAHLGLPITYSRLSEEAGRTRQAVKNHASTLRRKGLWRWHIVSSATPPRPKAPRVVRVDDTPFVAKVDPGHLTPGLLRARKIIEYIKASRDMIPATNEVDDPPHGIAPRSHKDHAAWAKKKFVNWSKRPYQAPAHRSASARKTAMSQGNSREDRRVF